MNRGTAITRASFFAPFFILDLPACEDVSIISIRPGLAYKKKTI
jgi:hypothetical protein